MTEFWLLIAGFVLGLIGNEFLEVSPWLAKRLVPRAARLWTDDPDMREVLTEAWLAIIQERPGKLFKLMSAAAFFAAGLSRKVRHQRRPRVTALSWGGRLARKFAGVDEALLDRVPEERPRYTRLGIIVLNTGVLAGLSMVMVVQLTWGLSLLSLLVAAAWAATSTALDRTFVAATHGTRRARRIPTLTVRLVIAVGMGLLVGEAVVLSAFRPAIDASISEQRSADFQAYEAKLRACNALGPVPDACDGWTVPAGNPVQTEQAINSRLDAERQHWARPGFLERERVLGGLMRSSFTVEISVWALRGLLVFINLLPILVTLLAGETAYDRLLKKRRSVS